MSAADAPVTRADREAANAAVKAWNDGAWLVDAVAQAIANARAEGRESALPVRIELPGRVVSCHSESDVQTFVTGLAHDARAEGRQEALEAAYDERDTHWREQLRVLIKERRGGESELCEALIRFGSEGPYPYTADQARYLAANGRPPPDRLLLARARLEAK